MIGSAVISAAPAWLNAVLCSFTTNLGQKWKHLLLALSSHLLSLLRCEIENKLFDFKNSLRPVGGKIGHGEKDDFL